MEDKIAYSIIAVLGVLVVISGSGFFVTQKSLSTKEDKLSQVRDKNNQLGGNISTLKTNLSELETTKTNLLQELNGTKEKLAELNSTKEDLEKRLSKANEKLKKPRVWTRFVSWYENINNSEKATFEVLVYNGGDKEAKGIVVGCAGIDGTLTDVKEQDVMFADKKNIGNIASHSSTYEYITIFKGQKSMTDYGTCKIISCENCKNLDEEVETKAKIVRKLREAI